MDFQERDPFAPIVYTYQGVTPLHREVTPFQEIQVLEHPHFGRLLVLDGVVQLTERDELFYHEMLVHPALHVHPAPRDVLIVGGGDGGSLREALKHPTVRRVDLVEIDERVVAVSREFFAGLATGFDDPRVTVLHQDGVELVERPTHRYDVIIVDSTDPVGPAERLFSTPFYRAAADALTPEGLLVTQSESLHFHRDFVAAVQRRLREAFPIVDCYTQPLATYAGNWWAFGIASKARSPRVPRSGLRSGVATRHYSREVHQKAFLPRSILRRLVDGTLDW